MEEETVNATAAALCVYTVYREEVRIRETDGDVEVHKLGRGIWVAEEVPASGGSPLQLDHG